MSYPVQSVPKGFESHFSPPEAATLWSYCARKDFGYGTKIYSLQRKASLRCLDDHIWLYHADRSAPPRGKGTYKQLEKVTKITYNPATHSVTLAPFLLISPVKTPGEVKEFFELEMPELPDSPYLLVPTTIASKCRGYKYIVPEGYCDFWHLFIQPKKASWEKMSRLFIDFFQGLQALHKDGLVHGDISLQNIVVMSEEPPQAALIDLDTARESESFSPYTQTLDFLSVRHRGTLLSLLQRSSTVEICKWYNEPSVGAHLARPSLETHVEDEISSAGLCLAYAYFAQKPYLSVLERQTCIETIRILLNGFSPIPSDSPRESYSSDEQRTQQHFARFSKRLDAVLITPGMPSFSPPKNALASAISCLRSKIA